MPIRVLALVGMLVVVLLVVLIETIVLIISDRSGNRTLTMSRNSSRRRTSNR